MIYVIKCGDFHKIGFTSGRKVEPRLKALQVATPYPLELVDVWPGSQQDEARLHQRFEKQRVRGEWFTLAHADLMWIAGIAHMRRAVYGYPKFGGQMFTPIPAAPQQAQT